MPRTYLGTRSEGDQSPRGAASPTACVTRRATPAVSHGERWRVMKVAIGRLIFAALLLGAWEFTSGRVIPEFFISKPTAVFGFLASIMASGELWPHLAATLEEAAIGYVLGALSGIGGAIVLSRFPFAERVLQPFVMAFYGIPRIALAPLFIIWFGIGLLSKVVIVVSVVFFIAFVNTLAGLRETDPGLTNTLRAMGANERQLFTKVRLPAALPWIAVGLKVGVPYALVGAIIGELLAASQGFGILDPALQWIPKHRRGLGNHRRTRSDRHCAQQRHELGRGAALWVEASFRRRHCGRALGCRSVPVLA